MSVSVMDIHDQLLSIKSKPISTSNQQLLGQKPGRRHWSRTTIDNRTRITAISKLHHHHHRHHRNQAGDQILRVNGLSIEQAIHEEVIALIKSTSKVTLKVKSVGMLPVKDHRDDCLSWRLLNEQHHQHKRDHHHGRDRDHHGHKSKTVPAKHNHHRHHQVTANGATVTNGVSDKPCPVHAASDGSWSGASSSSSSSVEEVAAARRASNSSHNGHHRLASSPNSDSEPLEECQVYLSLAPSQGLGCSVVKGPVQWPGIFVQSVKTHGVAYEAGLETGDQIVGINGSSLLPGEFEFNDAIAAIKSSSQMTLTVRKRVGLSLFNGSGLATVPESRALVTGTISGPSKTIHKIRAVVHHSSPSNTTNSNGHQSLCPKHSTGSNATVVSTSTESNLSERDYSMHEVGIESGHCKLHPNRTRNMVESKHRRLADIHGSDTDSHHETSDSDRGETSPVAKAALEAVRREEERLAEERRKLEADQRRLREELDKLDIERYKTIRERRFGAGPGLGSEPRVRHRATCVLCCMLMVSAVAALCLTVVAVTFHYLI